MIVIGQVSDIFYLSFIIYYFKYINILARMDDGAINTALPFKGGRDTIIINGKGSYKLFKKSKNIQDVDINFGKSAFNYNLDQFEGKIKIIINININVFLLSDCRS